MTDNHMDPAAFRRVLTRSVVAPLTLLGVLATVFVGLILYLLSAARWVDHTDRVIARGNALLKLLVDGETGMRGYVITKDPVFLEPYEAEEERSDQAFDELSALVSDNPTQVERLAAMQRGHDDWQEYAKRVIALRRDGGDYLSPIQRHEGKRRMDALRVQIAEFIAVEERIRDKRVRTTSLATWLVAGASIGLALLLGVILAALTRGQLRRVSTSYQGALTAAENRAVLLTRSAHRLETLHLIDRAILSADSMTDLIRAALKRMDVIAPSRESFVLTTGQDEKTIQTVARTEPSALAAAVAEVLPAGALVPAGRNGPHVIDDVSEVGERSAFQERLHRMGCRSCLAVSLRTDEEEYGTLVLTDPRPAAFTDEHRIVAHEIARQLAIALQQDRFREQLRRHAEELERRVEERTRDLQEALSNVRQLQGMLPICAWCKQVRDDQNYWHKIESYISARTDARFTHGICPACLKAHKEEIERLTRG